MWVAHHAASEVSGAAPLLLAIDQGTTGTTCLLAGLDGRVHRRAYREVRVAYPRSGWVEQDGLDLVASVTGACRELLADGTIPAAVGITNQRESVVVFERDTLEPVAPAIVWQCRRSAAICAEHRGAGDEPEVRRRTGLLLDPYFTATKLEWLLRERPELRARAARGELCAGTVDAWLVARLSGGARIATDASNASRTLLYDLHRGDFDDDLCAVFGTPRAMLATALGHIACRRRMSVVAERADRLFKRLKAARLDGSHEAEVRKLIRVDLLLIDDFALQSLDATETADIYEVVVERHRRASTVITSNREPAEWIASMADTLLAQSAVDRLQSASYELVIEGESYRRRQRPRLGGQLVAGSATDAEPLAAEHDAQDTPPATPAKPGISRP